MKAAAYLSRLRTLFEKHSNAANAAAMKKYLRNKFEFYGIKTPERKELVKQVIQEIGLPDNSTFIDLCYACFGPDEKRELQHVVNDFGQRLIKKQDPHFFKVIEDLIPLHSWWDTIDFIAPKLAGPLLQKFPEQVQPLTNKWIHAENFWFQRTAILFQLNYKDKTDGQLLFQLILKRVESEEFFIQKAAGWALRQYARVNEKAVRQFIEGHPELSVLTRREATKWLG